MSKKFRLLSLVLAVTAVAVALRADDKVLVEVTPETPQKVVRGKAVWEDGVLHCTLPGQVVFTTRFKVDPSKIYTLRGEFRSTSGKPTADNIWFGFMCFNKDGREISSLSINRISNQLGEVAETAAKGSQTLVLHDLPADWTKLLMTGRYFAIGAKEDRSDIPNLTQVAYVGKSFEKRHDGTIAVKLSRPLPFEVAAGTKVAIHFHADTYQFVSRKKAGSSWTAFGGSYAVKGESGVLAFRPTTTEIAFGFFCRDKEGGVEVRNLKLVESED